MTFLRYVDAALDLLTGLVVSERAGNAMMAGQ